MAHYLKDNPQSITVCIGPEGGFEESEIQVLNEFGFDNCSLGKNILSCRNGCLLCVDSY